MKEMPISQKGIVRRVRRTLKTKIKRDEVCVWDIAEENFIGDWPMSGEGFIVWIDKWTSYVHC